MSKPLFKGSGTAIVTPCDADLKVNYDMFGKLVDFQLENGTDAIIVCGTTGEATTLSDDEQIEAIRFVVERVNKRIPVIAGAGSNDTEHAAHLSVRSQKAGADALLIVTPYYNKATPKGLVTHYEYIAKKVDLPIVVYNVPSRTGLNITPKTILELSKIENIKAVKEACSNIEQIADLAYLINGRLDLYSGNDDQILPILSLGGIGVISVLSNVAPRDTHDMVIKYLNNDHAGATAMQLRAMPLIRALFCEVSPMPVKQALKMMGFDCGTHRLPLCEMESANIDRLRAAMTEYGLIQG